MSVFPVVFTETTETDTDALISSFLRKVPKCSGGCPITSVEEDVREVTTDKGKLVKVCAHCGDNVRMVSADRAGFAITEERQILKPAHTAPRSSVTRFFTSPYGRVKLHVSVHSNFAPFVELNGVSSPVIKRLVDEDFGQEAWANGLGSIGAGATTIAEYDGFVNQLKSIVQSVHLNPNAPSELDLDLAA